MATGVIAVTANASAAAASSGKLRLADQSRLEASAAGSRSR